MNNDLQQFKTEVNWFIKDSDRVEITDGTLPLTAEFTLTFPYLARLVDVARVSEIRINNHPYKLISWTTGKGESCGPCSGQTTMFVKAALHK